MNFIRKGVSGTHCPFKGVCHGNRAQHPSAGGFKLAVFRFCPRYVYFSVAFLGESNLKAGFVLLRVAF